MTDFYFFYYIYIFIVIIKKHYSKLYIRRILLMNILKVLPILRNFLYKKKTNCFLQLFQIFIKDFLKWINQTHIRNRLK